MPTAYPYAAVLFDMDGTLIDNVPLHQAVWKEFTRQYGLNLSDAQLDFAKGRKAMEEILKPMSFPAGYNYTFEGGDYGDDDEAMQQMMFNLLIALLMIYVVMAAVFESLLFPAAIMSGVLFSIFGVFWLFWITGTAFGIMSFIGILVLMGVVVNNGIVMIEHINNLRRRGMARTQALVEGSRERLRPISGARQQEGMARQLGDILWLQKSCSWRGVAVLPGTIDRTRTP